MKNTAPVFTHSHLQPF